MEEDVQGVMITLITDDDDVSVPINIIIIIFVVIDRNGYVCKRWIRQWCNGAMVQCWSFLTRFARALQKTLVCLSGTWQVHTVFRHWTGQFLFSVVQLLKLFDALRTCLQKTLVCPAPDRSIPCSGTGPDNFCTACTLGVPKEPLVNLMCFYRNTTRDPPKHDRRESRMNLEAKKSRMNLEVKSSTGCF